jgi:hypothetical protein
LLALIVAKADTGNRREENAMPAKTRARRTGKLAALAAAAAALGALTLPLAPVSAQPYLGWDFGGGIGIGIGPPPSAYNPCPNYGWPAYPYPCAYRYYGHAYPYHHSSHRYRRYSHASKPPSAPAPTQAPTTTP